MNSTRTVVAAVGERGRKLPSRRQGGESGVLRCWFCSWFVCKSYGCLFHNNLSVTCFLHRTWLTFLTSMGLCHVSMYVQTATGPLLRAHWMSPGPGLRDLRVVSQFLPTGPEVVLSSQFHPRRSWGPQRLSHLPHGVWLPGGSRTWCPSAALGPVSPN